MFSDQRQDICILTCFFNPAGFHAPIANFQHAIRKLLAQGAPVITVEAAFDNLPFQLTQLPGQQLIQLRAPARIWLKERLLNIALTHVPAHIEKVAWIDTDLIFEREHWLRDASALLDSHEVLQLFDTIRHLPPQTTSYQGVSIRERRSLFSLVDEYGADAFWMMQQGRVPFAVPGGAFAARRSVMSAGLYDRHVMGENDNIFAYAVLGALDRVTPATTAFARSIREWELRFAASRTDFTSAHLPGTIYHLWHGDLTHRGYLSRSETLRLYDFDPSNDLAIHENGCFRWNSPKPGLHDATHIYFRSRLEDCTKSHGAAELPPLTTLPHAARNLISQLYRQLANEHDTINRIASERDSLRAELAHVKMSLNHAGEWAKELDRGKSWLQSQLDHWQRHAESLSQPTAPSQTPPTVLIVAPDSKSSASILRSLAALKLSVFEIAAGGVLTCPISSAETLAHSAATVILLHYLALTPKELDQAILTLAPLELPVIWSSVADPLAWYSGRMTSPYAPTAIPRIDPAQFVALVEMQRDRARIVQEGLTRSRGVSIEIDGTTMGDEALSAIRRLLTFVPDFEFKKDAKQTTTIIEPDNLAELLNYLDRIGATMLRDQIVASTQQSAAVGGLQ